MNVLTNNIMVKLYRTHVKYTQILLQSSNYNDWSFFLNIGYNMRNISRVTICILYFYTLNFYKHYE